MKDQLRLRYWIAVAAAAVGFLLGMVTIVWRDWIEIFFGVDPDRGSGALEWFIVAGCLAASALCLVVARYERRRARQFAGLT
jgi:hypothetical protein